MLQPKTGSSFGYEISVAEFNIELSRRLGYRISCNECQTFVFHRRDPSKPFHPIYRPRIRQIVPEIHDFFGIEMPKRIVRENSASIRTEKGESRRRYSNICLTSPRDSEHLARP